MSNVKTYKVVAAWFDDAEVSLQVDHDVLTPDLAMLINGFWSGSEDRLKAENGDVVRAVVRLFGSCAISYFMSDGGARMSWCDSRYWTEKAPIPLASTSFPTSARWLSGDPATKPPP